MTQDAELPRFSLRNLLGDQAVQAGLRQALAGLLAFYWALSLQLPSPSWAVLTVMMLMIANYVGAIAEKAILRAVGTVAGAILGVWLAGSHSDSPGFLLGICFLLIAFGTMMFGGTLFPYAFFLGAVTISVVIDDALRTPDDAWKIGLNRIMEICIGIAASVVVSTLVWPRYAREDFRRGLGRAVLSAKKLVTGSGVAGSCDLISEEQRTRIQGMFMQQLNILRNLMHFGSRESRYFAARSASFEQLILRLSALFESAVSIGRDKCFNDSYGPLLGAPLEELHSALAEEFDALSATSRKKFLAETNPRIPAALKAIDARLAELVERKETQGIDFPEVLRFSVYYGAVIEISAHLREIRQTLHALPSLPSGPRRSRATSLGLTKGDVRNGIKTALSVVVALVFVDWLQPPGSMAIPPSAFLFTTLPRLNPAGGGDTRSFLRTLQVMLLAILLIPLLLLATPFLASSAGMAAFVICGMFIFGFWSSKLGGMTGWTIVFLLFFCGVIGLNPQEPVGFQSILGMAAGTTLGITIASFVQRFLWPVLPQAELRRGFERYYRLCGNNETTLKDLETETALFFVNIAQKIQAARGTLSRAEAEKLKDLSSVSQRLGFYLIRCRSHRRLSEPGGVGEFVADLMEECEKVFQSQFDVLADYFTSGDQPGALQSASVAALRLSEKVAGWRQTYLEQRILLTQDHVFLIATTEAYFGAAKLLDEIGERIRGLNVKRYAGDYFL